LLATFCTVVIGGECSNEEIYYFNYEDNFCFCVFLCFLFASECAGIHFCVFSHDYWLSSWLTWNICLKNYPWCVKLSIKHSLPTTQCHITDYILSLLVCLWCPVQSCTLPSTRVFHYLQCFCVITVATVDGV